MTATAQAKGESGGQGRLRLDAAGESSLRFAEQLEFTVLLRGSARSHEPRPRWIIMKVSF